MRDDLILTRQAAEALGVRVDTLLSGIRNGRIPAPAFRDASGRYWFSPGEVDAARRLLSMDRRRRHTVPMPEVRAQCHQPARMA